MAPPFSVDKVIVKALYKFKGTNNDELNFFPGDILTVTQQEEGGWWEGTSSDGKTGWFPSNYVRCENICPPTLLSKETSHQMHANFLDQRRRIISEMIERESDFIAEIQSLLSNCFNPLHQTDVLDENEIRHLMGNLEVLKEVHCGLLSGLSEASKLPDRDQRIGRVLLLHGSNIKTAHHVYCANYFKAASVMVKHRTFLDKFIEDMNVNRTVPIVLDTILSLPFIVLQRYSDMCYDLQQYLEDEHPDRGDTQRCVSFYKNLSSECTNIRRLNELELEILTGPIHGWEGEPIGVLGDIIHLGFVRIGSNKQDERCIVLFNSNLLILSFLPKNSQLVYEGKLPLSGISVCRLDDSENMRNAFEISGSMIDKIIVSCQSKSECLKWDEILRQYIVASKKCTSLHASSQYQPVPPPHKLPVIGQSELPIKSFEIGPWKMNSLRPAPPTRSYIISTPENVNANKNSNSTDEEDIQILRVIESYCTSDKKRQTCAPSSVFEYCVPLTGDVSHKKSENLKIIKSTNKFGVASVNDSDNGGAISDIDWTIENLLESNRILSKKLDEEISCRQKLEMIVKQYIIGHSGTRNPTS